MNSCCIRGILCLWAALLAVTTATASQVRPINLETMVARAETIFAGRCVEVTTYRDADLGVEVVEARFSVDSAVKGASGDTVVVRQLAGTAGLPSYRPDAEVILFLYGRSRLGLQSPVGFGQGRFEIVRDKQGRRLAINSTGNRHLFEGVSPQGRARLGTNLPQWRGKVELDAQALLDMTGLLQPVAPDSTGAAR